MDKIKKYAINKITVSSMGLLLLLMFYFLPSKPSFNTDIINENKEIESVVYLLDDDNYISRVVFHSGYSSIEKSIKEKLEVLRDGSSELNGFYTVIPKDTKINSVRVDKNKVYIDFDSKLLSVNKYLEDKMISSIVYTVSEGNDIDEIYISVNGKNLEYLPISKKQISYPLNRTYGINKEYNIISLNNVTQTTIYFSKDMNDYSYYVPVSKINNSDSKKIDIILNELKSGVNSQNNLKSYINENLSIVDYDIEDNKMNLVFNDYIFNDSTKKVILEEVVNVIAKSIFENYDIDEITFSTSDSENIVKISKND